MVSVSPLPNRHDAGGLVVINAAVVTVDDAATIHDPGWVHIVGDTIVGVGDGEAPAGLVAQAERVIDAEGSAVMPGMTNAHTHLFQTFFRGLADDKPLLDWLRQCIWPGAVHLDAEAGYLAGLCGMVENLRTGATSVLDHHYVHVDDAIDDAVLQSASDSGVRYMLARGWADRNYPPEMQETPEQVLSHAAGLRERWQGHDDDRIRIEVAPLLPWGCTDEAMKETVAKTREWGAGTHIHIAESEEEVRLNVEERGTRHVEWLDELGLLGPDMQFAHSVWLDDNELDLIAASGASVVSCPVSNMFLASGVPRILDMRSRNINVALASDGPGSNNRQDMFEVLKTTVLLQKVHHLDAMALLPGDSIEMACRGGAKAFGTEDSTGMIAAGRKADVVLVDLNSIFIAPVHSIESALVFNASPANVTHVVVDGRVLIDDRKVTFVDEDELLAESRIAAARVFKAAGVESRLNR
ncbi:MAG: 5-methylthioadenosine/S-adenosylhomocysteine deaminase [Paracrocinitomix sp.]|jgi:5-methylthioadenosine/S-adenosylhomocysteine deaminase